MFDITTYIWCTKTAKSLIDKVGGKTVDIETSTGQLDEEALKILEESKSSMLVLNQKVYRLSRIEGTTYKYINSLTDGSSRVISITELDVDTTTGNFESKILMIDNTALEELRAEFEAHRDNNLRHVSDEERERWNNKVTASITLDEHTDYILNLSKD